MANRPRNKGTAAESALVKYLRARVNPATERRALSGSTDKGDINIPSMPWLVIEVKNCRTPKYQEWVREAEQESINAHADIGVVVHKPHGVGLEAQGDWHVVMNLHMFLKLIERKLLE